MKTRSTLPALVLGALAAAAFVRAADTTPDTGEASTRICPADDRVAGIAGLRAFIDPQTGQLRPPTAEEALALSAAARVEAAREIDGLEAVLHADGMMSLDLKGQFLQNVVVRRAPDGSLSIGCVEGPSPSVPLHLGPAKPAPVLEEK